MKILKYNEKNFFNNLKKHINKRDYDNTQVIDKQVKKILNEVKLNGDSALLKYSKKFDVPQPKSSNLIFVFFKFNLSSNNSSIILNLNKESVSFFQSIPRLLSPNFFKILS